jgi:hypothetical protein
MSNIYKLVNPYIQGDMKTSVKSKNSVTAAKSFYKSLSEHFNNNIPKFYFTIQKGGSGTGKYYHFIVKELKEDEEVKFNIEAYNPGESELPVKRFEANLKAFKNKFEQAGGKAKKNSKSKSKSKKSFDDSDDSDFSDSSEEFYRKAQTYKPVVNAPLYYWWYDPQLYNLKSIFVPTFYPYVYPYIELKL